MADHAGHENAPTLAILCHLRILLQHPAHAEFSGQVALACPHALRDERVSLSTAFSIFTEHPTFYITPSTLSFCSDFQSPTPSPRIFQRQIHRRRRRYPVFQHHPITKRSPPEPHPHPEKPLTSSLAYKMSSTNPIPPIDDICARWPGLWAQGDLLDSLICCQMFPDQHHMNDDSIAYVLRISYSGCAGMTGKDVVELYEFFLANPAFRSNPITYWQNTKNQNVKDPADRHLVTLAILRFGRKSRPKGKGR